MARTREVPGVEKKGRTWPPRTEAYATPFAAVKSRREACLSCAYLAIPIDYVRYIE